MQIEVGENDTYSGSFGNAFGSGAYGVFGGLAIILHSDKAASAFNQAVQELAEQNAIDPEFSWEYLSDPRGLTRSFGQMLSSMAAIAPTMLAMPETTAARGIAALAGDAITQALVNRGLYNAAKVFAEGAQNAFRYAATSAPVEGLAEGGHVRTDLLNEGYSDEEATKRSINTALANIPVLAASNFAEGLLLGAPLFKTSGSVAKNVGQGVARWQLNSLQQALEESTQKGISNWQTDKTYSFNPLNYTPDQSQEFWEGYFGLLPLGIASGVSYATSRPNENAQRKDRTLKKIFLQNKILNRNRLNRRSE